MTDNNLDPDEDKATAICDAAVEALPLIFDICKSKNLDCYDDMLKVLESMIVGFVVAIASNQSVRTEGSAEEFVRLVLQSSASGLEAEAMRYAHGERQITPEKEKVDHA